jgi:hypothetical protein
MPCPVCIGYEAAGDAKDIGEDRPRMRSFGGRSIRCWRKRKTKIVFLNPKTTKIILLNPGHPKTTKMTILNPESEPSQDDEDDDSESESSQNSLVLLFISAN